MDPNSLNNICPVYSSPSRFHGHHIKWRRCLLYISIIDFVLGLFRLSAQSIRTVEFQLIDDTLVDHFGIFAVIWLYVIYSLQIIVAMIFLGATFNLRLEKATRKFKLWFNMSFFLCVAFVINGFAFYVCDWTFKIESIPAYCFTILEIAFRIFGMTFLVMSNPIFGSYASRLQERINSAGINRSQCPQSTGTVNIAYNIPPPIYPDELPPNYEEATGIKAQPWTFTFKY